MIPENHPVAKCQKCGGKNVVWYAENILFNEVNGSPNGIMCPHCFEKMCDEKGIEVIFRACDIARETTELSNTTKKQLKTEIFESQEDLWTEMMCLYSESNYKHVLERFTIQRKRLTPKKP